MAIKRLYSITIKGKNKTWGFPAYLDPQYLDDWRKDGLEIDEIMNSIPEWVPSGLIAPWCFIQDIFNFRFDGLKDYFRKDKS